MKKIIILLVILFTCYSYVDAQTALQNAPSADGASPQTVTFPGNTTAGSIIWVGMTGSEYNHCPAIGGITDSEGNTYTPLKNFIGTNTDQCVYVAYGIIGGTHDAVTCTKAGGFAFSCDAEELGGVNSFDSATCVSNACINNAVTSGTISSPSINTNFANEIVIGFTAKGMGGDCPTAYGSNGAGWTGFGSGTVNNQYKIFSTTQSGLTATVTNTASCEETFGIYAFYQASGQAAAPTFSPVAGTYTSTQNVTVSSTSAGTTKRCTVDGSTPTGATPACAAPVVIATTTTLKAIATGGGFTDSNVTTGVYSIQLNTGNPLDPAFKPVIDQNPADYPANIWVTDTMTKVKQDSGSPGNVKWAFMYAAKNEFESFQIHEHSTGSTVVNSISIGDLVNAQTGEKIISATNILVYREAYYNVTKLSDLNGSTGQTPDALIPAIDPYYHQITNAFPFTITSGNNQSFWIDVLVPSTVSSGWYSGTAVLSNNGSVYTSIPIVIGVWNFSIPSTSTLHSAYGSNITSPCTQFFGGYLNCHNYQDSSTSNDTGVQLSAIDNAVMLLDNRVTSSAVVYFGPTNNDWTSFDSLYGPLLNGTAAHVNNILRNASISSIQVPMSSPYPNLQDWTVHFQAKGWLPRLFIYTFDEPHDQAAFTTIINNSNLIHAVNPPGNSLVTTDIASAATFNALTSINTLVPELTQGMEPRTGSLRPNYNNWLNSNNRGGNFLWLYEACSDHGSCGNGSTGDTTWTYPSTMIDATPIRNRIMQWVEYTNNVQGDLYYAIDYCWYNSCGDGSGTTTGTDPWTHQYAFGGQGDGTFTYPGTPAKVGTTNPIFIPSFRLKMVREGYEDYEYLIALKNAGDTTFVNNTIASFYTNAFTYSTNGADLMTARQALGNELHSLSFNSTSPPSIITLPIVTGNPIQASVLTTTNGTWNGVPVPTFTYKWLRCDSTAANCVPIAAATATTYTLVAGDVGFTIRSSVTGTNSIGTSTSNSGATSIITSAAVSPVNTSIPIISGTVVQGQVLSTSNGTWTGVPSPTFTYQWRRCDSGGASCINEGASSTSINYTIVAGDVGSTIRINVTGTNTAGNSTSTSIQTILVVASATPPVNTVIPTIGGSTIQDSTLSVITQGTWTGTQLITFTQQWQRCLSDGTGCVSIPGATGLIYTNTIADIGSTIRVSITGANSAGSSSATSLVTTVIIALVQPPSPNVNLTAFNDRVSLNSGSAVSSALITVCVHTNPVINPCNGALALLWKDSARINALSNPFRTDVNGNIFFWGMPGNYDITISGAGIQSYTYSITLGTF